jgi:hypothetical protein
MMVMVLTTSCVLPDLKASLVSQQDHDEDDHDDDQRDNQAKQQIEAMCRGLLRCCRGLATTHSLAVGHPRSRHPAGRSFMPTVDRSSNQPLLFLRLQI